MSILDLLNGSPNSYGTGDDLQAPTPNPDEEDLRRRLLMAPVMDQAQAQRVQATPFSNPATSTADSSQPTPPGGSAEGGFHFNLPHTAQDAYTAAQQHPFVPSPVSWKRRLLGLGLSGLAGAGAEVGSRGHGIGDTGEKAYENFVYGPNQKAYTQYSQDLVGKRAAAAAEQSQNTQAIGTKEAEMKVDEETAQAENQRAQAELAGRKPALTAQEEEGQIMQDIMNGVPGAEDKWKRIQGAMHPEKPAPNDNIFQLYLQAHNGNAQEALAAYTADEMKKASLGKDNSITVEQMRENFEKDNPDLKGRGKGANSALTRTQFMQLYKQAEQDVDNQMIEVPGGGGQMLGRVLKMINRPAYEEAMGQRMDALTAQQNSAVGNPANQGGPRPVPAHGQPQSGGRKRFNPQTNSLETY